MFDGREELLQQIRLGEDTALELKTVGFRGEKVAEPRRNELADELAAIANTHDGVVVLGVDDKTRDIMGISTERLDAVERFIYEICNEGINPPILYRSDYFARLFQQGSQARLIRFEEQSVPQSGIDDLSEKLWTDHISRSSEPAEIALFKRGILTNAENGGKRPSVAGILLRRENPERFMPNAYIEAVRYRGKRQDSNYQIDARKIRGPLNR